MGHIYRYNNNKNNNISKSVCKTSVNESFGVGAAHIITYYIAFTGRKEKVTATYFFLLYRFLYLCVCVFYEEIASLHCTNEYEYATTSQPCVQPTCNEKNIKQGKLGQLEVTITILLSFLLAACAYGIKLCFIRSGRLYRVESCAHDIYLQIVFHEC